MDNSMDSRSAQPQKPSTECREFLASVPDAAILVNNQNTILAANAEATRLLGYLPEELEGASLDKLLPERFHTSHHQHLADYFRNPWPRPMGLPLDLVARHKQGHEIDILVSLSPWQNTEGTVTAAYIRDMTEQKALETAVRQAKDHLEEEVKTRTAELQQANQQLRAEINERQRVEEELRLLTTELTQRHNELKRELQSLENYSQTRPSTITSQAFQLLPLAESVPDVFHSLTREYERLLDKAVEVRTYRVDNRLPEKTRLLAEQLGAYNATPHDVVQLHSNALKAKVTKIPYPKTQVYFEEGRLLVLELMGHLAAYYRRYSLIFQQKKSDIENIAQNDNDKTRED